MNEEPPPDLNNDGVPDVVVPGSPPLMQSMGGVGGVAEEEYIRQLEKGWGGEPRLPVDERPIPDTWHTSDLTVGSQGWKNSQDAFCQPFQGAQLVGLEVDARGVFAAVSRHCGNTLEFEHCDPVEGGALFLNDGDGWELLASPRVPVGQMHAFEDGSFLLGVEVGFHPERGAQVLGRPDGVPLFQQSFDLITRGNVAFAARFSFDPFSPEYQGPFLLTLQAGADSWAVEDTFEGHGWVSIDAEGRLVIFRTDEVFFKTSQGWEPMAHLPAGQYGSKGGWFESQQNFWVVGEQGIVHCEGGECHLDQEDVDDGHYQFKLLGDRLYFLSESTVGFLQNHESHLLSAPDPALQFSHLAATPEHIFVSAYEWTLDAYECGGHVLLWFDGSEFHRF